MAKKPSDYDEFAGEAPPRPSDYDEFAGEAPPRPEAYAKLKRIVDQILFAREQVASAEEMLKSAKERLRQLEEIEMPDAMGENWFSEHTLKDGTKIVLKDDVRGGLPKDELERTKAIGWIEDNDGREIIKTEVAVKFPRTQHNVALNLAAELREKGYEGVICESGVHTQTLWAWVREMIRDGRDVDYELLGVVPYRKVVITPPKAPPAKRGG